jgi:hypothetical protein
MATAINSGYKAEIINLAVTSGGWTALTLPYRPNNLLLRLREVGDLKISLDASGTTYLTIKDGTSATLDWNPGRPDNVLWLQGSVSGTAEIFATYE